jgi:hypothetical protein
MRSVKVRLHFTKYQICICICNNMDEINKLINQSNMYRYTVRTQLCYLSGVTIYQLHVSATLLGHYQVVLNLQSNCITYQCI